MGVVVAALVSMVVVLAAVIAWYGHRSLRRAQALESGLRAEAAARALRAQRLVRQAEHGLRLLRCPDRRSICAETLVEVRSTLGEDAPAVLAVGAGGTLEPLAFSRGSDANALRAFAALANLDLDTRDALAVGRTSRTTSGVLVVPFGDRTGTSGALCLVADPDEGAVEQLAAISRQAGAALEAVRRRETTGSADLVLPARRGRRGTTPLAASDIHRGLLAEEFCCHFQPLVSLSDRTLTGFESFARWHHPHRGMLLPERFLAVAEDTGLIITLGNALMDQAAAAVASWGDPRLSVSVNLSSTQFTDPRLTSTVADTLRRHRLSGASMMVEVSESAVLEDSRRAAAVMAELRSLGVQVSVDDFGTGYSSLSWLLDCAAETVKVDKSLVAAIDSKDERGSVTDAVMALAHALGMDVIAEGVETEEQLRHLRSAGCGKGQGWLFGRPMDRTAAAAAVTHWPRSSPVGAGR